KAKTPTCYVSSAGRQRWRSWTTPCISTPTCSTVGIHGTAIIIGRWPLGRASSGRQRRSAAKNSGEPSPKADLGIDSLQVMDEQGLGLAAAAGPRGPECRW